VKIRLILIVCIIAVAGLVIMAAAAPAMTGAPAAPKAPGAAKSPTAKTADTAAEDAKPAPTYEEAMADPNRKVAFVPKTVRTSDNKERGYFVWIPLDYTPAKKWPIILFLHGAGESGTDPQKVLGQGVPKEIKNRHGKFEFIVVIPQSTGGWGGMNEEAAVSALKATGKEYSVDPDRVYLTGLSMGGYGAYSFARTYPKYWAAVVACCGGGSTASIATISPIPFWIWHSDDDPTVNVSESRKIVTALFNGGAAELKYTEVHGSGHSSWDRAYPNDEVWTWLLAHKVSDLGRVRPVMPVIDAPTWPEAPKVPTQPAKTTPTKPAKGGAATK